jgi:hypothetical protein
MKKFSIKNQQGYAILFSIVLISAISIITAGLSNSAYKQIILSSLAKDSQVAFYQADTASDCAFYADLIKAGQDPTFFTIPDTSWSCGGYDLRIVPVIGDPNGDYSLLEPEALTEARSPCFNIIVDKEKGKDIDGNDIIQTNMKAKGYNICNKNNPRTVEREIEINY